MIRKRGNSYEVRAYNPAVKKNVYAGSRKSRSEARRLEREKEEEFARSTVTELTVADWAERWPALFPRDISTETNYRGAVRKFVDEHGDTRIRDIDKLTAREWAVVNRWRVPAVRLMFNDAIKAGVLYDNPFSRLGLEQSRGRRDLVVLTDDELRDLGRAAEACLGEPYGSHFRALVWFAACTAIRPGELFALDWERFRPDELEADIDWQISQKHGRRRPKRQKTRTIVVPPPAVEAALTMPRFDGPHIFATPTGKRFSASTHFDYWSQVRDAAGWFGMDFYELRHYGATKLLELGLTPEEVAIQMGHDDGGDLVRDVYGHPSHERIRERIKAAWVASGWQEPPDPSD